MKNERAGKEEYFISNYRQENPTFIKSKNGFVVEERESELVLHRVQADLRGIYLEPTSRCNLECITCARREWFQFEQRDMESSLFQSLLGQLEQFPQLHRVHLGGFGEPLAHPDLPEMIEELSQKGLKVTISTNGTLLNRQLSSSLIQAGVESITFSMDSLNPEQFARIRQNAEKDRVIENISTLRQTKESLNKHNPRINLEFVIMRQNADQVTHLPQLARRLGIASVLLTNLLPHSPEMYKEILYEDTEQDRRIKAGVMGPPTWNNKKLQEIIPSQPTWPVVEQGWILWGTMNFPRMYWGSGRKCNFIDNNSTFIGCSGMVSPCYALMYSHPYYLDNRRKEVKAYHLGSLYDSSLYEIWNSPEYLKFRHRVRNYQFPSCMDCQVNKECEYAASNEDCWGASPSCADCLWSQGIIRCP